MATAQRTETARRHSTALRPLSLIVPVYNEAENFPRLVAEVERWIEAPFTLVMVYDRDEDTTVPVAKALAATRPWLSMVKNSEGRGVVGALRTGFETVAKGPALVVMADLSDDLSAVAKMRALYDDGYQVICPSRYMAGGKQMGGPWLKRTLSRLAGWSLWLIGFPTHDATNNFRMYDAAMVRKLGIESSGGFELALELTAKANRAGAAIAEVPTVWSDRTAGESRFNLRKWLPKYLYWYGYAAASVVRRTRRQ